MEGQVRIGAMRLLDRIIAEIGREIGGGALALLRVWKRLGDALKRIGYQDDDAEALVRDVAASHGAEVKAALQRTSGRMEQTATPHAADLIRASGGRVLRLPGPPPRIIGDYDLVLSQRISDDITRVAREAGRMRRRDARRHQEEMARRIDGTLNAEVGHVLTANSTEAMTSYRRALFHGYRASGLVSRVQRVERLDSRTCPVCWALHGEVLDMARAADMAVHPNCRGIAVPILLGQQPRIDPGSDLFDELDPETQRRILGRARYEAYERGEYSLRGGVGTRLGRDGEPEVYLRTLRELGL